MPLAVAPQQWSGSSGSPSGYPPRSWPARPSSESWSADHKTEIIQAVDDDICGEIFGPAGRGAGTLYLVETGHRTITIYADRYHVVDVETGSFLYDYDDPAIPDVRSRYVSPFNLVVNKGEDMHVMENLHEFVPGDPDGIDIKFRYHLTWRNGEPIVEREYLGVTGCP